MAVIGFGVHTGRPAAVAAAEVAREWLRARGHEVRTVDDPDGGCDPSQLDLAVSLGGDGTMLRTVDAVSAADVPVLGVNLGHLGYLTTVEPDGLTAALERFLAGDYRVEPRMTLDVDVSGGEAPPSPPRRALNDVVLQRDAQGHTVRAEMSLNGVPFLRYAADSLIVCTPTGSTAYNLSARGPIVSPRARVFIVTPVAPHGLFDRSLVLDAGEEVELRPVGDARAELVVDGWGPIPVVPGQTVTCRQGRRDALLVTFEDRDFHRILKRKFDLTDR
ncbi:NAD(+)/NADH kinase [Acidiferrimicrobium sp. IK]|uniref:NAD(+)/NADH kinase n=1 Tax=Acidiferrimicrobium sp. IK TaxID=2871700 RepID=UPI0021CAE91F|nr:NAD(+)/NADH kinase [Acidiferrimicrobium sp. IK]MCU4184743.1 NAD(+)/NADH kinase [Acidiferrimicrobium sp. IK]